MLLQFNTIIVTSNNNYNIINKNLKLLRQTEQTRQIVCK